MEIWGEQIREGGSMSDENLEQIWRPEYIICKVLADDVLFSILADVSVPIMVYCWWRHLLKIREIETKMKEIRNKMENVVLCLKFFWLDKNYRAADFSWLDGDSWLLREECFVLCINTNIYIRVCEMTSITHSSGRQAQSMAFVFYPLVSVWEFL